MRVPQLTGRFEGTPARSREQAQENAAWRVLEQLRLCRVVELLPHETLAVALKSLGREDLELLQAS